MMISKTAIALTALVSVASAACGINQAATNLIQGYEVFRSKPYNDGYGYWTVGYGHRCIPNNQQCSDVSWPLSESAAQQLFQKDIAQYENCLSNSLSVCLNANQYGALVSWTFNEGCGSKTKKTGMAGSTLIARLDNKEDPDTVARSELPKWNKAGGKVSQGLVKRRNSEINLFTTGTSASGNCNCGGGGGGGSTGGSGNSGYGNSPGNSPGSSDGGSGTGNSPGGYSGYSGGYSGSYGGSGGGGSSGGGSGGSSGGYYRKAM